VAARPAPELIESPVDPDRRSVPRWLRVGAVLLIGAGLVGAGLHAMQGPAHQEAIPVPRPTVTPGPSCAQDLVTPAFTGHASDWPRITAPTGPGPAGVAVLAWSVTPLLHIDLATGTVTRPALCVGPVDGVFPVAVPWARVVNVADHGDRRVLRVDPTDRLREIAGDQMANGGTTALPPAGAYAVPGHGDSLLVVARDASGQTLTRYTTGVRPISAQSLPDQYLLLGETSRGLVVRQPIGRPAETVRGRLLVLDPATLRVARDLGAESDPHPVLEGDHLAWFVDAACPQSCVLRVADLGGGGTRDIAVPGTRDLPMVRKVFAPDGSAVALSYADVRGGPGRVIVVAADGGTVTTVPGIATTGTVAGTSTTSAIAGVTWTADSRWLVLSTSTITFGRLAVWDPRTGSTTAMPWVVAQNISADQLSAVGGGLLAWR